MNYLWAGMILIGVVYAAFTGSLPDVTTAALDSAKEAVTLCITMLGVMSFWMGLMKIAENAGMIATLAHRLRPVLHFLFPQIPKEHIVNEYLSTNMIANILGLGWAATPLGLKAMEELQKINEKNCERYGENQYRGTDIATKEMCDFLIINISSLQLVPINIIAYRTQYGSIAPTDIMGAAIAATTVGTIVAIVFCKLVPDRGRVSGKDLFGKS
ncbi:MAG: nucleoside recognition protein [Roseburia sp.]|nr:nucleoside recognition protein [Roseburia sp.]